MRHLDLHQIRQVLLIHARDGNLKSGMHSQTTPDSTTKVITQLAEDAQALFAKLAEVVESMQSSSDADVNSTYQHLCLYREAVTNLQVVHRYASDNSENFQCAHCWVAVGGRHGCNSSFS